MNLDEGNIEQDFPLVPARDAGPMLRRRADIVVRKASVRFARVLPRGERRRDFRRRYLLRGMDELRRRQNWVDPPPPGDELDTAL